MDSCYNINVGFNNRDNKQSGRRNFGRRDFGGPGGVRQMYKAICSACGKDCEVPFKPSGAKPVFCNNCFEKNRGNSGARRFEDRDNRLPQNSERYNTLNAKLDKILSMLTSSSLVKTPKPQDPLLPSEDPVFIIEKKKKTPEKAVLPPKA